MRKIRYIFYTAREYFMNKKLLLNEKRHVQHDFIHHLHFNGIDINMLRYVVRLVFVGRIWHAKLNGRRKKLKSPSSVEHWTLLMNDVNSVKENGLLISLSWNLLKISKFVEKFTFWLNCKTTPTMCLKTTQKLMWEWEIKI